MYPINLIFSKTIVSPAITSLGTKGIISMTQISLGQEQQLLYI